MWSFVTFADVTGRLGLSRDDMALILLISARATEAQTPEPTLGFPGGSQKCLVIAPESEAHTIG